MPLSGEAKKAYMRDWYRANRAEQIEAMAKRRAEIKDLVFTAYGGYKCACCGNTEKLFLTIDHVDGQGNKHRKEINRKAGYGFYYWLVQKNFPSGFQVLCFNCNLGRSNNDGICPHKDKLMAKMKANPLGHLEMELVHDQSTLSGGSMTGDNVFRDQVPVHETLAGADTFKEDASKPTSRADIEKRRGYFDSGVDLKGASMKKEFGGGDAEATAFTDDKSR